MSVVVDLSERGRLRIAEKYISKITGQAPQSGFGIPLPINGSNGKLVCYASLYRLQDSFILESDIDICQQLSKRFHVEDLKPAYRFFSVIGFDEGFMGLNMGEKQIVAKRFNMLELIIAKNCIEKRLDFFIPADSADGFVQFLFRKEGTQEISLDEYKAIKRS